MDFLEVGQGCDYFEVIWGYFIQFFRVRQQIQQEMFYSLKTEALDQQNYSPNYFYQQPTLTQGLIANDIALSKAISIIEELKENLSFALKLNQALTQQNQQLKSIAQRTTKKVNSDSALWQKRLKDLQTEKQQIIQLLQQTKRTLVQTQQQFSQKKKQIEQYQRIIFQQKKSYQQLQQNFMNQSLANTGETSINLNKSDLMYIKEIENQNHEKEVQIRRLNQQLEKNQGKIGKLEKENGEFRKWLASVLGLQRVVDGSQRILMKEIGDRLSRD